MYAGIFIGIICLMTFTQSDSFDKFSSQKLTMVITDSDDTEQSHALIEYLKGKNDVTVETDPDTDKLMLNIFYQKTDCLLNIKKGYGDKIHTGRTNGLFECSYIEGSYVQSMVQNQLDKYVKTVSAYIRSGMAPDNALGCAQYLMDAETEVKVLSDNTASQGMTGSGKTFFGYLPYT